MKRFIGTFLLLASCSQENQNYAWFENDWVSDTEASIAINPDYVDLDDESLKALKEMYGKIRWSISNHTMKFFDDRYNQNVVLEVEFTIVPIDSGSFQMEMPVEARTIWKTDTGFCTVLSPDYLSNAGIGGNNVGLECFKPYGT